ncbi:unnamed protein product [Periconia digitata]|uniref:Uncharacterized protein n=1 Tax=Periconia digitata TaxID=1303443 RepID=A0A9W4UG46_9PLEO|nr:unnamed protein product [Periconia digitata]
MPPSNPPIASSSIPSLSYESAIHNTWTDITTVSKHHVNGHYDEKTPREAECLFLRVSYLFASLSTSRAPIFLFRFRLTVDIGISEVGFGGRVERTVEGF